MLGGVIFVIVAWAIILLVGAFALGGCAVKKATTEHKDDAKLNVSYMDTIYGVGCDEIYYRHDSEGSHGLDRGKDANKLDLELESLK